jgi:sec-independent protein translocase protein TatC
VGREIDGGDMDEPGRYRPMTDAEMEAELDAIEAEEAADDEAAEALVTQASPAPDPAQARVEELIRSANARRADGDTASARTLLYLVLEEGDADQRRVARNILADLDRD